MSYNISLPQFEGPFDLLLFFIQRDEVDIYDIPISTITNEFLTYINQMQDLNIDVASEFIVVAASLMRIKAKMLLPRKELNEAGEEIDPREELVKRLLEYKRYKEVLTEFKEMEETRQLLAARGDTSKEMRQIAEKFTTETDLESFTLFKLLKTFQRVLQRMESNKEVTHQVVHYPFTIRTQKSYLLKLAHKKGETEFEVIFSICETKYHAIFTFLAMLEMVQERILKLKLGEGANNFWIGKGEGFQEAVELAAEEAKKAAASSAPKTLDGRESVEVDERNE